MANIKALENGGRLLDKLVKSESGVLGLATAAKRAEGLTPLTGEQAEAMPLAELAGRAQALLAHLKLMLITEHDFIVSFRVELNVLRRRCKQQGRRVVREGEPSWGEIKKAFTTLSGRQIDRLLEEPGRRKARKALPPVPSFIVTRGDAPSLARGLRGAASDGGGGPDAALLQGFAARLDEEWALALLASLQDRLYDLRYERHRREALEVGASPQDAAEHAHLMAQQEEDDEEEERDRRRDRGKAGEVPEPAAAVPEATTPEAVAALINRAYAAKPGRHEAVRQMLRLLDKCVLMEAAHGSADERLVRLHAKDPAARHPNAPEAVMEMLGLGGFWSAKAILEQGDIHVHDEYDMWEGGINLERLKGNVLNRLRQEGKLKTRMLGGVYWYTLPGNEAALRAAKRPEGPEFHHAEGELQKGGGSAAAPFRAEEKEKEAGREFCQRAACLHAPAHRPGECPDAVGEDAKKKVSADIGAVAVELSSSPAPELEPAPEPTPTREPSGLGEVRERFGDVVAETIVRDLPGSVRAAVIAKLLEPDKPKRRKARAAKTGSDPTTPHDQHIAAAAGEFPQEVAEGRALLEKEGVL